MKNFKKLVALVITLSLLIVVGGCGQKTENTEKTQGNASGNSAKRLSGTIILGNSYATTGPYAKTLKLYSTAAQMAVEDINKSGLLDDAKIEIIQEDTGSTPETAINGVQRLMTKDKAMAFVGPGASDQALAAIPLAQKAEVLNLNTVTTPQVAIIGDYVFSTSPIYPDLVPAATEKVVKAYNIKTAAIITRKDYPLAVSDTDARRTAYANLGVKVVVDEETLLGTQDFSSVITKIMAAKPDVVTVDGHVPHDPLFIKQLKAAGYKGIIFPGASASAGSITKANAAAFDGAINMVGWLPNMPNESEKAKDFATRFKERTNGMTADNFSAGVYDGIWMWATAIKKAGTLTDKKAIRDALTTVEIDGVMGKLKFNDKRTFDYTPVMIQIDKDGKQVPLNI